MTTVRKRWWRMAALAVVGGGVATGAWYSFGQTEPQEGRGTASQGWAQAAAAPQAPVAPPTPPAVMEVDRMPEGKPITGAVVPAGGVQSTTLSGGTVAPVVPVVPVSGPPVPAPSMPAIPSIPSLPAVPSGEQPISAPAVPAAMPTSTDRGMPAVPSVPAVPGADLPSLPVPPKPLDLKPVTPAADKTPKLVSPEVPMPVPGGMQPALPGLPPLPSATAEPPKASTPPMTPVIPPMPVEPLSPMPAAPMPPVAPQPSGLTPSLPPVKSAESAQPISPAKPDSGLNVPKPGNTLNPTVPALQPITPPGGTGREAPGKTVDRAKPPEPALGTSDKYVFPVPAAPKPIDTPQRDDTMHKLTTAAAFAALSGALLTAEKAHAFPTVPAPSGVPTPGKVAKADNPNPDVEKLKKDLEAANNKIVDANKKIDDLQKQLAKLTEQINGRKDDKGLPLPSDPGAVEEVKRLKDKITKLEDEIKALKTQTSLKPSVGAPAPEAKTTGIVKIINEYPVEISIVVNDKSHRVAPNKVVDIEVPAGEFSYQLLTAGAPATRSVIQKGETVRLRIK